MFCRMLMPTKTRETTTATVPKTSGIAAHFFQSKDLIPVPALRFDKACFGSIPVTLAHSTRMTAYSQKQTSAIPRFWLLRPAQCITGARYQELSACETHAAKPQMQTHQLQNEFDQPISRYAPIPKFHRLADQRRLAQTRRR